MELTQLEILVHKNKYAKIWKELELEGKIKESMISRKVELLTDPLIKQYREEVMQIREKEWRMYTKAFL